MGKTQFLRNQNVFEYKENRAYQAVLLMLFEFKYFIGYMIQEKLRIKEARPSWLA